MFNGTTQRIESLLDSENKSVLRPVINQNIPFYINKDVQKEIFSLGAVGGGFTPTDLDCSPVGSQGSLMELFWQLPEHCGKLSRFQIEYDQMTVGRRSSGAIVESDNFVYAQSEPQFYEVPGNKLNAFMDYLCPGYSYQFRIRSANDAGWGMWSKPIVGNCEDFPFTLEYTKSIHRVVIPTSSHYRITVKGAKAEDGLVCHGGKGAIISATFSLKAGDVLILLCGGMSSRHHYHSGGGGGSFVTLNEISQSTLLIAAGGGGGTRGVSEEDLDGSDASIYTDGKDGLGEYAGKGGVNGSLGEDARDKATEGPSFGNGGAGFMQDSSSAMSFLSGGHGGQNGGFGGGGAVGMYGGGGGGGYSGGGGGRGGGGGGSYVSSTSLDVTREVGNNKHGSITIVKVLPPYPISNIGQASSVSEDMSVSDRTNVSSTIQNARISSHLSSSSVDNGSNSISLSSKATSSPFVGTSVGTISESSQESPASTSQVMDQAEYAPGTATFYVGSEPNGSSSSDKFDLYSHGGVDGGVAKVSEVATMIPTYSQSSDFHPYREELMKKVSPEDKALIAQQLSYPLTSQVYPSQSHVALMSTEGTVNLVKPSKNVALIADGDILSLPMKPTQPTPTSSDIAGIIAHEGSVTPQWLGQHQEHNVEAQRYFQLQQQQQVHQQLMVQGIGQDDLSPPLTQQQLVLQQQQLMQQQQLQILRGERSPPLLTQQQHVAMASQPSSQVPNSGSDPSQCGQQPSIDYTGHQNWNSKN